MKILITLACLALLFFGCNDTAVVTPQNEIPMSDNISTETVTARITNTVHNVAEQTFQFDIECKIDAPSLFEVGNSTFVFETNMSNPVLVYKNPKFVTGHGLGYYDMYAVQVGTQFSVQIVYFTNHGPASALQTEYERIATVKLNVIGNPILNWYPQSCFMVDPFNTQAPLELLGSFTSKIKIKRQ